jgi:hypothetical protein
VRDSQSDLGNSTTALYKLKSRKTSDLPEPSALGRYNFSTHSVLFGLPTVFQTKKKPPSYLTMSSPEGDSAMPKVQETPSDTRSGAPVSYSFVNSDDKSRIRSHAMRASWRNRAASVPRRHRAREIAADESSSSRMEANPSRHGSRASSTEGPNAETADEEESEVFPRDGIYIDMRNTLTSPARRGLRGKKWRVSTRTYPHSRKQNPYRSIGEAEIDSFNSTQLSLEDQTLLHHCKSAFHSTAHILTTTRGEYLRTPGLRPTNRSYVWSAARSVYPGQSSA